MNPAGLEQEPLELSTRVVVEPNIDTTYTDLMEQEPGPTSELTLLLLQLFQHLHFLHTSGIIHRDVEPDIIGLSGSSVISLGVDYGVYCQTGNFVPADLEWQGSFAYTAPEYRMIPYHHSVDVWSAGIIFHELMLGEPMSRGKEKS